MRYLRESSELRVVPDHCHGVRLAAPGQGTVMGWICKTRFGVFEMATFGAPSGSARLNLDCALIHRCIAYCIQLRARPN